MVDRELTSTNFSHNKIGISPVRRAVIYLPAGYDQSTQRYPVIYFLPTFFDDDYRSYFKTGDAQRLFDRSITDGVIGKFILVAVDMSTPLGTSWYVNSPVTGNWEDFMVQELVPYIDANFKTLPNRDSRAIAGIFMGGYGAIRFGMKHPDVFGTVYAMHPVGTGSGVQIMETRPNWELMAKANLLMTFGATGSQRSSHQSSRPICPIPTTRRCSSTFQRVGKVTGSSSIPGKPNGYATTSSLSP